MKHLVAIILLGFLYFNCNENSVTNEQTETLVFQLDGIIENLGGDCSAVQVRTRSLGQIDFTSADKIKFNLSGMSDADLSSIRIYYLNNGQITDLVNLPDRDAINSTSVIEIPSPHINTEIYTRVTLQSSSMHRSHLLFNVQ